MIHFTKESTEKLRSLGVAAVYLFGSRVSGTAHETSDYDIGIVFHDAPQAATRTSELYTALYTILSDYFPDQQDGARLDLSFLQFANAALEMSAIDGVLLFESDSRFRVNYEESVLRRYDDYRHLRGIYEEATLRAFATA